ncbi:hypothetical protein H0H87_006465 [Tephrocybe sp. NHM501043]|nr:hypothetical protein H0H87_006465 [Tephrocybe sp. NHM501043]
MDATPSVPSYVMTQFKREHVPGTAFRFFTTMGKKSLNPADSFRKAQRKKELKKNKAERSKARDFTLVKKDTWDLEDEIANLEAAKDPTEAARLADLKAELEKINRKKAEYVEEHPEHRRLVYRPRRKEGDAPPEEIILPKRRIFDKNGLPRHPERSVYYDPVMNPFGVAPPGMPYMERPPLPGEVWTDEESGGEDEDIAMPAGPPPPPPLNEGEDYDVDDIEMPEGPPPGQLNEVAPPLPPGPPPPIQHGIPTSAIPPAPPGFHPSGVQGLPLPPPGPPPGFNAANIPPFGFAHPPPPPPAYPIGNQFIPNMPPPPPGFFPRAVQSASSMQDPLSSIPHQTFQAHHGRSTIAPHPSLPPNPMRVTHAQPTTLPSKPSVDKTAELVAATVFAQPQLRDFKKEATAFVPTTLKRKKPGVSASSSRVNAAPGMEGDDEKEPAGPARPDLLSALKSQFGPAPPVTAPSSTTGKKTGKKDDYDKFMEEMGDILGPTKQ